MRVRTATVKIASEDRMKHNFAARLVGCYLWQLARHSAPVFDVLVNEKQCLIFDIFSITLGCDTGATDRRQSSPSNLPGTS